MARTSASKKKNQKEGKVAEKHQEIVAILLIGLSLYCLMAIFSFRDNYDLPARPDETFVNSCGLIGYYIASAFVKFFGSSSIFLFLFVMIWGVALFTRKNVIGFWPKFFGILAFTVSASILFHLAWPLEGEGGWDRRPLGHGGLLGSWLEPAVSSGFGGFGTVLFSFIVLAISFLLATDWCFYPIVSGFLQKWRERRERLAEMKIIESDEEEEEEEEEDEEEKEEESGWNWAWLSPLTWLRALRDRVVRQDPMDTEDEYEDDEEEEEEEEEEPVAVKPAAPPKPKKPKKSIVKKIFDKKPVEQEDEVKPPKAVKPKRQPIFKTHKTGNFTLPSLNVLDEPEKVSGATLDREIKANAAVLEKSLQSFRIEAQVVAVEKGPAVTMFELELAAGTKVSKIVALSDDLAIALKAQTVRVVAPIPGKSTVGIEVPNSIRERVRLKELMTSSTYKTDVEAIPLFLGKDLSGNPIASDLAKMPHLLIAGSTGSGKSVMINSIICSVLMTRTPDEVKMILVDPKMVELQAYKPIPHLLCPVVTNPKKAATILEWACMKMDGRYELLSELGVKHITDFNELGEEEIRNRMGEKFIEGETPTRLPYMVVIIDELADLMLISAKEVETSITRLAQKSRAVGIHVILATQRPSTDVITGLIKANMPTRVAFQVASKIDSRVVLDSNGAEKLLGGGDMLFTPPRSSTIIRAQGAFVDDREIKRIVTHLKEVGEQTFSRELVQTNMEASTGDKDELYEQAVRIVIEQQRGSASLLQRALGIGYTRASRLIDIMRQEGLVGEYKGSKSSEVMMTLEDWEAQQEARKSQEAGAGGSQP